METQGDGLKVGPTKGRVIVERGADGAFWIVNASDEAVSELVGLSDEENQANANLFADALNTHDSTGLTPSQLRERCTDLKASYSEMVGLELAATNTNFKLIDALKKYVADHDSIEMTQYEPLAEPPEGGWKCGCELCNVARPLLSKSEGVSSKSQGGEKALSQANTQSGGGGA